MQGLWSVCVLISACPLSAGPGVRVRVRVGVIAGLQQGVTAPDLTLSRPPHGCARVQVEEEPPPPGDRLGRVDLRQVRGHKDTEEEKD